MRKLVLLFGIGLLIVVVAGGIALKFLWSPASALPSTPITEPKAHSAPAVSAVQPPSIQFRDITGKSGVQFVHFHGGYGQKLMPETMGAGVLVFDFDRDNDQDVLFVNSRRWPHHQYKAPAPPARLALYQNDGTGQLRDVTEAMGLVGLDCYGMGTAAGDIDNDGHPDLVITALNGCYLFHNEEGKRFRDITESSGLKCPGWSSAAAFVDYDLDGKLDLFIGHYVKWTPETDLFCKLVGDEKSYCQPMNYQGEHCQLFHNLGGSKFEDVSAKAGTHVLDVLGQKPVSKCLGVAIHDYDDDGWPDIAVANDTTPNFLFHNNGNGTFKNVASAAGIEMVNASGSARGAMGIQWGYYRGGETLGLAIANFANEPNALLRYSKARQVFSDAAIPEGIGGPSRLPLKFGLFFFDYDLDGRLDLFSSNGHIEPEIERVQAEVKYAQPAQLFWNVGVTGQGCYRAVEEKHAGADLFKPRVGRGAACGDLEGDGDLDIVLNNNNQPATVLRNECPSTARSIRLRFNGVTANRDGYGCRVKVIAGGQVQQAELNPGGSYLSQNEAVLTFGLGEQGTVEKVEIRWPTRDGKVTKLENLPAGHTYVVDEEKGIAQRIPFRRAEAP